MIYENLKIENKSITLVDQVEDSLLSYIKENKLQIGDSIPSEQNLADALGVARNVLREALSRLKMMGIIESRTRRGMTLKEPSLLGSMRKIIDPRILSEQSLFDILGFRIALEIGICHDIFLKITSEDIKELEEIESMSEFSENNEYSQISEYSFHSKLYEITGNKTISEFQNIIHPVMDFVKIKFKDLLQPINIKMKTKGELVTHKDLLSFIKKGDEDGFRKALEKHFALYNEFIHKNR